MKYQAITIDTQTIYDNELQLHRGVIAQLEQYKNGPVQVVLSEIILREIARKLSEKAKAPVDALHKTIRDGESNGQITIKQKEALKSILESLSTPRDHANLQVRGFVSRTGAMIVEAQTISVKNLLDAYFGRLPPFSNKGKKDEFPDAIALLTLEIWAEAGKKKILAVSKDTDWKAFADRSPWIDCFDDLPSAMNNLLEAVGEIEGQARAIIQDVINGKRDEDAAEISQALSRATELEAPSVDYSSDITAQDEYASLSFLSYRFPSIDTKDFSVTAIRVTDGGFVVSVPLEMAVRVEAEFSFYVHDSIDDDDVAIGSDTVERNKVVEVLVLIHFEKIFEDGDKLSGYSIIDVEISEFPKSIDIGHVSYSMAGEDDDFDPDDWKSTDLEGPWVAVNDDGNTPF